MVEKIEFTSNYSDNSTDHGFQFEFYCNRCGNGYRSAFQPWAAGTASSILEAASSVFGGLFNQAANVTDRVRDASWQRARDAAFLKATQEIKSSFKQCPHCSGWVCNKCWNEDRGLCKECAPDLAVEMSAAQSSVTRQKVWENADVADTDSEVITDAGQWKKTVQGGCPECGMPLTPGAKFCPECGFKIQSKKFCAECGAELPADAKFCAECGTKTS